MAATYDPSTIAIGVLGKPHGVQGEIALRLFNLESSSLEQLTSVILDRAGQRTARVVTRARPFGKGLLVTFEGISSRDEAAALTLSQVRVDRATLPTPGPGEYFVSDVIGCEVFDDEGIRLGLVDETFWNGAHDVMIIRARPAAAPANAVAPSNSVAPADPDPAAVADPAAEPAVAAAPVSEHLIPLVPDFIREVDVPRRTIRVAWRVD